MILANYPLDTLPNHEECLILKGGKIWGNMAKKRMIKNGCQFIGREVQLAQLKDVLYSDRPEFVAVYGRRRVGKTFLIRHAADNKFTFYYTAANNLSKKDQLANFALVLKDYSQQDTLNHFDSWVEAFHALGNFIDSRPKEENKIIFFDEIPWADSPKSSFLPAFENFWNMRCAFRSDIKVVVCGSATSWILNKIIHNVGGLYGRLTHVFKVEPFNLYETQKYFQFYGFKYSEIQLAEIYMILGGIPFYFSLFQPDQSIPQNIDRLFFFANAPLRKEFEILYHSLYKNPSLHLDVIKTLAKKSKGLTRQEIIDSLKIKSNGAFSKVLKELEEGGFIRAYYQFENRRTNRNKSRNNIIYQLIDLFSLFYLKFVKEYDLKNETFWEANYNTPKLNTWRGLSYETLCLWHIPQIKQALGINGVSSSVCAWMGENQEREKAQIDLLIDRDDNVINLCEAKWHKEKLAINKDMQNDLLRKLKIFYEVTKTRKTVMITLISTSGVKINQYRDVVQKEIVLSQLFKY